jgi:hypothetical protein
MIPPFDDNGYLGRHRGDLMSIRNRRQLETTRMKLLVLEERCRTLEAASGSGAATPAREISVRSLKTLINQMREENARVESRAAMKSDRT